MKKSAFYCLTLCFAFVLHTTTFCQRQCTDVDATDWTDSVPSYNRIQLKWNSCPLTTGNVYYIFKKRRDTSDPFSFKKYVSTRSYTEIARDFDNKVVYIYGILQKPLADSTRWQNEHPRQNDFLGTDEGSTLLAPASSDSLYLIIDSSTYINKTLSLTITIQNKRDTIQPAKTLDILLKRDLPEDSEKYNLHYKNLEAIPPKSSKTIKIAVPLDSETAKEFPYFFIKYGTISTNSKLPQWQKE